MSTAISVENVSKSYRLGLIGSGTLQEDFERFWARLRGRPDPLVKVGQEDWARRFGQHFWALNDVSFDVGQGEVLGVIGRNGAGKSTLLKILSQVTAPTSGLIRVRGRIASLLEVGTGFHPELTGRENIFLNGAILGMTKAEIRRKLDAIVAFSGVEEFIDTPVKRYSSGMYVRLAFAVAAHLEPEILIVDEVLAVGDAEFQAKCLGKMDEVAKKDGRTVLFVSHNMEAVSSLTKRAVLLEQGRIAMRGATRDVVARYLGHGSNAAARHTAPVTPGQVCVTGVSLTTSSPGNIQRHGEPMTIECDIHVPHPINGARFEIVACDERNRRIMYLWKYDIGAHPIFREAGRYTVRCDVASVRLFAGRYTVLVALCDRYGGALKCVVERICPFEVIMHCTRDGGWERDDGVYIEDCTWTLERTDL